MASVAFASLQKVIELAKGLRSDEDMYLRIVSSSRLAVGTDPLHPTHMIDIAREAVFPFSLDIPSAEPAPPGARKSAAAVQPVQGKR